MNSSSHFNKFSFVDKYYCFVETNFSIIYFPKQITCCPYFYDFTMLEDATEGVCRMVLLIYINPSFRASSISKFITASRSLGILLSSIAFFSVSFSFPTSFEGFK